MLAFNPTHRFKDKKIYTIKLIAFNDCGRDTIVKTLNLLTATQEPNLTILQDIQAFPNPFNSDLTVKFQLAETTNISMNLYDMSGKKIAQFVENQRFTEGGHQLSVKPNLKTSGLYYLQIKTDKGMFYKKIVRL